MFASDFFAWVQRMIQQPVARCACGRVYYYAGWLRLPLLGTVEGIEMRNCCCRSTIGRELP